MRFLFDDECQKGEAEYCNQVDGVGVFEGHGDGQDHGGVDEDVDVGVFIVHAGEVDDFSGLLIVAEVDETAEEDEVGQGAHYHVEFFRKVEGLNGNVERHDDESEHDQVELKHQHNEEYSVDEEAESFEGHVVVLAQLGLLGLRIVVG